MGRLFKFLSYFQSSLGLVFEPHGAVIYLCPVFTYSPLYVDTRQEFLTISIKNAPTAAASRSDKRKAATKS